MQANPTALTLSGVMMLRHMNLNSYADKIEKAMLSVIAEGKVGAHGRRMRVTAADYDGRSGWHEQVLRVHAGCLRPHPLMALRWMDHRRAPAQNSSSLRFHA